MSCAALDYWEEVYTAKGENRGKDIAMLNSIRSLMKNLKFTTKQAMDALSIPQEDRLRYADKI